MTPQAGAGGSASGTTAREEALVARLSAVAPSLGGDPDPEWQAATRTRLVAMAGVRTPAAAPAGRLRRLLVRAEEHRGAWRRRLTAGVAGAAAAVTGLAAVVALSADARPGDALYGVKRGTEQVRLAVAGDARGRTLLRLATTRLEELAEILEDGPPATLVEETLATMDAQTREGAALVTRRAVETGGGAPLDQVQSWSAGQSATLDGLLAEVPEAARPEAAASVDLLGTVEERAAGLRAALGCAGGPATAGSDELGPVPAACDPPGAPAEGGEPGAAPGDAPAGSGSPEPTAPPTSGAPPTGTGAAEDSRPAEDPRSPAEDPRSPEDTGSGEDRDGRGTGEAPERSGPALPTPDLPEPDLPTSGPPTPGLDPEGTLRSPLGGTPATAVPRTPEGTVGLPTCSLPVVGDC